MGVCPSSHKEGTLEPVPRKPARGTTQLLSDRASRAANKRAAGPRERTLHKTVSKLKLKVQKQVFT